VKLVLRVGDVILLPDVTLADRAVVEDARRAFVAEELNRRRLVREEPVQILKRVRRAPQSIG